MFELRVTSLVAAYSLIDEGWPSTVISLTSRNIPNFGARHLHLSFDDIAQPEDGLIHPTKDHLTNHDNTYSSRIR